jgi:tryptophan synthase alpha chain
MGDVALGNPMRQLLMDARGEGRAALLPYMTAGLPGPETSIDMFRAMADAGADGFEVGIPYSDPLMDGPTIHEAGLRALDAGTSLDGALRVLEQVRSATAKPAVLMTYVNPVLRVGPDEFARRAVAAGASGAILADLPAEEADHFQPAFEAAGLGLVLFVAPTTGPERLASVAATDPLFLYGIAEVGVTGERTAASSRVAELSSRVRTATDLPLVLGVGISTPEHAAVAAGFADGVIVGSALVRRVLDASDATVAASALHDAVVGLAAAVHAPSSDV